MQARLAALEEEKARLEWAGRDATSALERELAVAQREAKVLCPSCQVICLSCEGECIVEACWSWWLQLTSLEDASMVPLGTSSVQELGMEVAKAHHSLAHPPVPWGPACPYFSGNGLVARDCSCIGLSSMPRL